MSELNDSELNEIAKEAGLSREQLREAMAVRDLPARVEDSTALMEAPTTGMTAAYAEAKLALPADGALDVVRAEIERRTGMKGHKQGDGSADVVDERHSLTYRVRAADDDDGALVRVDVDPSRARGMQTLLTAGLAGTSLTLIGLGAALWTGLLLAGAVLAGAGTVALWLRSRGLRRAAEDARAIAVRALADAGGQTR